MGNNTGHIIGIIGVRSVVSMEDYHQFSLL